MLIIHRNITMIIQTTSIVCQKMPQQTQISDGDIRRIFRQTSINLNVSFE